MSVESAADRKRKCIVECQLGDFSSATSAVVFGNTVDAVVRDRIGQQKFRQFIKDSTDTIAITPGYKGGTVLQVTFLELDGQNMANFIIELINLTTKNHNTVHNDTIEVIKKVIRGKPQPQTVGLGQRLRFN